MTKRQNCEIVASEKGVGVINWPSNYRCFVLKFFITLKLFVTFYILKQYLKKYASNVSLVA